MPTPQGTRSQYALNGAVPNLTWDQFVSNFATPTDSTQGQAGASISALGPYSVGASRTANVEGGEGQVGDTNYGNNPWDQYVQYLPDGTSNYFTQGANGGVDSTNQTTDSDSWWDSTGLPLVASLAFGGATAGLSAAGVGVTDGAAGLANVGAGFGDASGATGLAGSSFGSVAPAASSATNDIGSPDYNPYNPSNFTADAGTGTASDASAAAGSAPASSPSFLDSLGNGVSGLKDWYTGLDPLAKLGIGSASSLASSELGGSSSGSSSPSSFSDAGYSAANGLDYNGGLSGSSNTPTLGGIFSSPGSALDAGASALNSLGIGNSANPYSAYASLLSSGLSAYLGNRAASNATNAQVSAANNSNALAAGIYANNTALNAPFVKTGTTANSTLGNLYGLNGTAAQTQAQGAFTTSPGYQFRLDQGTKAVQNSASAAGGLYSGRAAKDLTNYAQGAASSEYGNYTSGLSDLSNQGEAAANQQAANGNSYVANTSSNNAGIGNAQAAGDVAGTNAITNSLSNLLNQSQSNTLLQQLLKQQNGYYNTGTG